MTIHRWRPHKTLILLMILFLFAGSGVAEPIRVRQAEGVLHGFLLLRTEDGNTIAVGDLEQTVQGSRVTSDIKFRFKDGSIREETAVFSQHGVFRVIHVHLLEQGPVFKKPMEVWIDCPTGQVRVREMKDGKEKVTNHHVDVPDDLANGIVPILVKNFPDDSQRTLTLLAATPKPRIVKLVVTPLGEDAFSIEGTEYKAKHYVLKVDIGGIAGKVAPIVGMQPADAQLWILAGKSPIFLKSIGPLSTDTPVWQVELTSPTWPHKEK